MLIFAHRGASAEAPENTLEAFRLAFDQGAHGIEFDTYQHPEGILVFHDRYLERTTNGHGKLLDASLASLRALDAGNNNRIPMLSEVLAITPLSAWCNIEVKYLQNAQAWVKTVKADLSKNDISLDRVIVSSFNHQWLRQIKHYWPEVSLGALTASYALDITSDTKQLNARNIHVALDVVTKTFIEEAKKAGYQVLVYTVDNIDDMTTLARWGADGIFTNKPRVALEALTSLR